MSFRIKLMKNKGRLYAAIVEETYNPLIKRSSGKTIRTYGDLNKRRLTEPDIDERIQADLAELRANADLAERLKAQTLKDQVATCAPNNKPDCVGIYNYGIALYRRLWERLGLDVWFKQYRRNHRLKFDFDLAAFFLAALRILAPCSKKRTHEYRGNFVFDFSSLTQADLYETLGLLSGSRDVLIRNVNKGIADIYERTMTVALYDCTTFYFESFDSDELRARGMSKENRANEVQVVMGLLIDADGIPLDYELFRGNTSEIKTLLQVVRKHKVNSGLGKVTVIADRGLNCKLNLQHLAEEGFDYIVAQSISRLKKDVKERVLSEENWEHSERFHEDVFKMKRLDARADPERDAGIIVTWSLKRHHHDLDVLEELWTKGKELIAKGASAVETSMKHGSRQFLKSKKGKKGEYEVNTSLYEKRKKQAGFYVIATSNKDASPQEIFANLRRLWRVEECFRVLKSNLDARPVFVWTPEHIRGHFLVCYLALVLERLSCHLIRMKGIRDISPHKLVELMRQQNVTVLSGRARSTPISLRLGHDGSTPERKNADIASADAVMQIFGIAPVNMMEAYPDLKNKLACRLPFAAREATGGIIRRSRG